jgi:CheY-like chemotaxis protein
MSASVWRRSSPRTILVVEDEPDVRAIVRRQLESLGHRVLVAEAAREERPGLPVIFMSGYTAVPEAQKRIRDAGAPLLSKPFTTPQLERAVNTVCAAAN